MKFECPHCSQRIEIDDEETSQGSLTTIRCPRCQREVHLDHRKGGMPRRIISRNLTILFTDMKGFTPRTSAMSRSQTIEMIQQHKEMLLPVIESYGGKLIKAIGDAFLVVFESPTDAVLAGMALQKKLRQENIEHPDEDQTEIRVAINTGEVSIDEGDVYGEAVNIASRIEGIAEANEIYFTEATYLAMNKNEVPSAEIGYRLLKGIPHKIKVYKVLREGEKADRIRKTVYIAADSGMKPASHWKRICAFIIDLILVNIMAHIIMSASTMEIGHRDNILREQIEILETKALEHGRDPKTVETIINDNRPIPMDNPARDSIRRVRKLRDELAESKKRIRERLSTLWVLIFFIYQIAATGWKGQSLGKKWLGLKILQSNGNKVGWGKSCLRTFLYILSASAFGMGFVWALFDRHRQTWHDKIAETVVVGTR